MDEVVKWIVGDEDTRFKKSFVKLCPASSQAGQSVG